MVVTFWKCAASMIFVTEAAAVVSWLMLRSPLRYTASRAWWLSWTKVTSDCRTVPFCSWMTKSIHLGLERTWSAGGVLASWMPSWVR